MKRCTLFMDTSTDFPPLPSMQTDPPAGGPAPVTGSKATLRAREETSPKKPDAQRPKVRAHRGSFLISLRERFRRQSDACCFAVIEIMHISMLICSRMLSVCVPSRSQSTVVPETPHNKQGRRPLKEAIDSAAQANPKVPREEQEEAQEEVLEEESSCYLKIEQDKIAGKELVKINRGELVMAFAEAALEYELDDPIPDRGVGRRGPTGPYIIYLSEPDADKLLQNKATIFVGQGDNRVMCSLTKHVTRLVDDSRMQAPRCSIQHVWQRHARTAAAQRHLSPARNPGEVLQ